MLHSRAPLAALSYLDSVGGDGGGGGGGGGVNRGWCNQWWIQLPWVNKDTMWMNGCILRVRL